MVDIQPRTVEDLTYDDGAPWMVHVERTRNRSITLDLTAFGAAHKTADGRFILSGVRLKPGTGLLFVPAVDADTTISGFLFGAIEVLPGSTKSSAALMTAGVVNINGIPGVTTPPLSTAQRSSTPLIQYVDRF